ncbi:MAG: hypothetical protein GC134_04205 [Proteobacteria bacterium]|nr:hypothetical protein [Pseudomonadota bacterium]
MQQVVTLYSSTTKDVAADGPAVTMNSTLRGLIARALRKNRINLFLARTLEDLRRVDPLLASKWEIPLVGGPDTHRMCGRMNEFMNDVRNATWRNAPNVRKAEVAVQALDYRMMRLLDDLVQPTPFERYQETTPW